VSPVEQPLKWLRILSVAAGLFAIAISLLAESLGIGSGGFGGKQIALVLAGLTVALLGLLGGPRLIPDFITRILALEGTEVLGLSPVAWVCVWFAVVATVGETTIVFIQATFGLRFDYFRGLSTVWMTTASYVTLFLAVGLGLSWLGRLVWSVLASRLSHVVVLTFLTSGSLALLFQSELGKAPALLLASGITAVVARFLKPRLVRFWQVVRRTTPVGLAVIVLVGPLSIAAAHVAEGRKINRLRDASPGARNVLLLILDTVRAHDLGLYGYPRQTTPFLSGRAKGGIIFEHAYSTAPWTLASHASLFTGRWPHELSADHLVPLDGAFPTVAETFAAHGFRTGGFVANQFNTGPHTGLARGYHRYEADQLSARRVFVASKLGRILHNPGSWGNTGFDAINRKKASAVRRQFISWVSRQSERPFFAFLNYFDAHDPYDPPVPFDSLFHSPPLPGGPFEPGSPPRWTESDMQDRRRLYDAAIAYLDTELETLFQDLEKMGIFENTVVVITSDHGEEFAEHGVIYHGKSLYDTVLRVPLVILNAGGGGVRVARPVSLRDVSSTMLELAGVDDNSIPGSPLSRYWRNGPEEDLGDWWQNPASADDMVLSETTGASIASPFEPISKGNMLSAVVGQYHYILRGDGAEELFDRWADEWEERDLSDSAAYRPILSEFRTRLDSTAQRFRQRVSPFWPPKDESGPERP